MVSSLGAGGATRPDHVVPVAMEAVAVDVHGLHLLVRDSATSRVLSAVQTTDDLEAFRGGRAGVLRAAPHRAERAAAAHRQAQPRARAVSALRLWAALGEARSGAAALGVCQLAEGDERDGGGGRERHSAQPFGARAPSPAPRRARAEAAARLSAAPARGA